MQLIRSIYLIDSETAGVSWPSEDPMVAMGLKSNHPD